MIKKPSILAIIPARGGSKSIPKKNIKMFAGKPLILHTIHAALASSFPLRVVVSTDDDQIAAVSKETGVEIINRPAEFAQDHSTTHSVVEHVLHHLEKQEDYKPDAVLLLQPTSPLRTAQDIDKALELFLNNECKSVVAVCPSERSVYWSFKSTNQYLQPLFGNEYFNLRSQELPKAFVSNGAIFISTPQALSKHKSFFNDEVLPYVMNEKNSIDIDGEDDFALAEFFFKKN